MMSLNQKIQALAEVLNHDPEDLRLWLAEYPVLSNRAAVQLLLMATRYRLDPICDEVSLMETASGMSPFITIDGWVKLINSHEQFAGMSLREPSELTNELPAWIECTIYRHDRILPIVVREYMDEVKTEHSSWLQMPRRMLRHRAIQQCARLAFGITCAEGRLNAHLSGFKVRDSEQITDDQEINPSSSERTSGPLETKDSRVSALKQRIGVSPLGKCVR